MILKEEWLSANYCKGCCPQSPLPPTATSLRSNKPKNIYRDYIYDLFYVIHVNAVIA
jgi:hypothetical protein